jgi:hypothetical protein
MKKPRQGRHIRGIIWRRTEKELFAEDVAPDGAGKLFGAGFYKDAAPTALGEMAWLFVKRIHQQTKQVNSNDHDNQLHYRAQH